MGGANRLLLLAQDAGVLPHPLLPSYQYIGGQDKRMGGANRLLLLAQDAGVLPHPLLPSYLYKGGQDKRMGGANRLLLLAQDADVLSHPSYHPTCTKAARTRGWVEPTDSSS